MALRYHIWRTGYLLPKAPCTTVRQGVPTSIASITYNRHRNRGFAIATPANHVPSKGSKGPTAMVFLNMGGPSTTDEVENFLSRLFVCHYRRLFFPFLDARVLTVATTVIGRCRPNPIGTSSEIPRSTHCSSEDAENPKTIFRYWRWLANSKMVRVSM